MIYKDTQDLIDAIRPFCNVEKLSLSTENIDWRGRPYKSDLVRINPKYHVVFEVFDIETQIGFFDDHIHFENYSSGDKEDRSYVPRAKEFLVKLFTLPIVKREVYKGKRCVRYEYFFITPEGKREHTAGIMVLKLLTLPFQRKTIKETTVKYQLASDNFESFDPGLI